jgi:hypothetical protein
MPKTLNGGLGFPVGILSKEKQLCNLLLSRLVTQMVADSLRNSAADPTSLPTAPDSLVGSSDWLGGPWFYANDLQSPWRSRVE